MIDLLVLVALSAATWYALGRLEAHLLRTSARHPASTPGAVDGDGPRLLPVPDRRPAPAEAFPARVDQLGVRDELLDAARDLDRGQPLPDAVQRLIRAHAP